MFMYSAVLDLTVQRLVWWFIPSLCSHPKSALLGNLHLPHVHIVLGGFRLCLLDVLRSSATSHHLLQVCCRRPLGPSSSTLQTDPDRSIINPSRHVLNQLANEWSWLHYICLEVSRLISAEGSDAASPRAPLWGLFRSTLKTAALPFYLVTTFLEMQSWVWSCSFRVHFYRVLTFLEQTWLKQKALVHNTVNSTSSS